MDQQTRLRVLRVDASARTDGSVTRGLADHLIAGLATRHGPLQVRVRDLGNDPVPVIGPSWVDANFTAPEQRSVEQRAVLAQSDALVRELQQADVLVLGVPVYNFGIPAALKAWIDLVARARLTFRYTEHGPEGLLRGKRAYLVMASGGVEVGGATDLGIGDVELIAADRLMARGEEAVEQARDRSATLAGALRPALA